MYEFGGRAGNLGVSNGSSHETLDHPGEGRDVVHPGPEASGELENTAETEGHHEAQRGNVSADISNIEGSGAHLTETSAINVEHHDEQPSECRALRHRVGRCHVVIEADRVEPAEETDCSDKNSPWNFSRHLSHQPGEPAESLRRTLASFILSTLADEYGNHLFD